MGAPVAAITARHAIPMAALVYMIVSVGARPMRSDSQPVVRRPARLTRLTVPSAVAAAAGVTPCPIAYAMTCVFISGNANAPAKRASASHQKGAERSAARTVHGAGASAARGAATT